MLPKPLVTASFEPFVLAYLSRGESYGYKIIQGIQDISDGRIAFSANRLYPLLHDLENRGLVSATWQNVGPGPGRKYYKLTNKGQEAVTKAKQDWLDVNALLASLWGQGPALSI